VSEIISLQPPVHESEQAGGRVACSVCGRESTQGLAPVAALPEELQKIVLANAPAGALVSTICPRCLELFERARVQLTTDSVIFEQGGLVLPTPLRLDADERFTGAIRQSLFSIQAFTRIPI